MSDALFALTLVTALGCGLNAGVFFAFSTFVMAGLRRLPAPQAIAAMQSINVTRRTPAFMTALLGTGAALHRPRRLGARRLAATRSGPTCSRAALLYLVGVDRR